MNNSFMPELTRAKLVNYLDIQPKLTGN